MSTWKFDWVDRSDTVPSYLDDLIAGSPTLLPRDDKEAKNKKPAVPYELHIRRGVLAPNLIHQNCMRCVNDHAKWLQRPRTRHGVTTGPRFQQGDLVIFAVFLRPHILLLNQLR